MGKVHMLDTSQIILCLGPVAPTSLNFK